MQYFISFLEGIITFISPCLLPMLPVYISYFAGGKQRDVKGTLLCAFGFVAGFTAVFAAMGAMAGTAGSFLKEYQTAVNLISGAIVVFFGLSFIGVIKFSLFRGGKLSANTRDLGFFSSALFGMIFSIGWTPCVGAFLGSALLLASQQAHAAEGTMMLVAYSVGLGVPFILSAALIERLKSTFDWIKRNYRVINLISGGFLILTGILMATGTMGKLLNLLS